MISFEVVGGNDRRSMIKRYERKSKQQAISELVDLMHCNWRQVELLVKCRVLAAYEDSDSTLHREIDAKLAELSGVKP